MEGIINDNNSEHSFQFEGKFDSVKQLLNSEEIMLSSPFNNIGYGISDKFKAIILMETFKKNTLIRTLTDNGIILATQDDIITQMKLQFLSRWKVTATNKTAKVIDKLLKRSKISRQTFLYRIKIAVKQIQVTCKRVEENLKHNNNMCVGLNHNEQLMRSKNEQYKVNNYFPSNDQRIDDLRHNNNNNIEKVRVISKPEYKQYNNAEKYSRGALMLQKIRKKRLFDFLIALQNESIEGEWDFSSQLLRAKRNLQLAEMNFQIENEVQQINDNYYEKIERLDRLTEKISEFQTNINYSRLVSMSKVLKKLFYPRLGEFFLKLHDLYYPKILEELQKQKYQIMEMVSGSIKSNLSRNCITVSGLTSFHKIPEEDLFKLQ